MGQTGWQVSFSRCRQSVSICVRLWIKNPEGVDTFFSQTREPDDRRKGLVEVSL